MRRRSTRSFRNLAALLTFVLAVAILYFAREVLIPFTLAVLFAFLLAAPVRWVERLRVGRIPAVLVVMTAALGAVGLLGWVVGSQAAQLADNLPRYQDRIAAKIYRAKAALPFLKFTRAADQFSDAITAEPSAEAESVVIVNPGPPAAESQPATAAAPVPVKIVPTVRQSLSEVGAVLLPVVNPLVSFGIAVLLAAFFLTNREDLRDRVLHVFGRAHLGVTTAAVSDAAARVSKFIGAQALVNAVIGLAIGLGLYFMGLPNAVLWGLLAAVLRFIPYLGPFIAAAFPTILAAALFDSWAAPLMVIGWTVLVDSLSANLLEPWLYGVRTGVSPTGILVAFFVWTWLWGSIGLLLAAPITVCLVALGRHVAGFEILAILLGNEPVFEPKTRLYQRLLTQDRDEALQVVQRFARTATPAEVFDRVVLPAAAQITHDHEVGLLDAPRLEFVRGVLREVVDLVSGAEPAAAAAPEPEASAPPPGSFALLAPHGGPFDDLIPIILTRLARLEPEHVRVVSSATLAAEVIERVRRDQPAALVLTAIEPRSIDRELLIFKRLQQHAAPRPTHIGLFSDSGRGTRQRSRLRWAAGAVVHERLGPIAAALGTLQFAHRPESAANATNPADQPAAPPPRAVSAASF